MTDSEKLAVIKTNLKGWMDTIFDLGHTLHPLEIDYAWNIALALDLDVKILPTEGNEIEAKARKAYDKAFDLVSKNRSAKREKTL